MRTKLQVMVKIVILCDVWCMYILLVNVYIEYYLTNVTDYISESERFYEYEFMEVIKIRRKNIRQLFLTKKCEIFPIA